jgi:hypothetical protein
LVINTEVPIFRHESNDSQILLACLNFGWAKIGSEPNRLINIATAHLFPIAIGGLLDSPEEQNDHVFLLKNDDIYINIKIGWGGGYPSKN